MTRCLCPSRSSARRFLPSVFVLLFSLLAALPLRAAPGLEWAPLTTRLTAPVTLPVQMANGAMVVDATLNGQGPFHMIVDTGCSASVVSPAVAAAIEPRTGEVPTYVEAVDSLGAVGAVQYVVLDTIDLGAAHFTGVSAGISSLDLQSRIAGVRIDGILGYNLFSALFLTLDFPGQRITLSRDFPTGLPPVRSELAIQEANAVPYVTMQFQGRDLVMMLDSGANGGLELNVSDTDNFDWKVEPRPAGLVAGLGGTGRDWAGRLAGTAVLGGISQPEPVVGIGEGSSRIGTGFLRTLCVVLSRAQNKLWLCSASADPLPSPARRTVGLSLLAEPAGWRVAGTIPGSPAEKADIASGDLISTIEDSPAQSWSRDDLQRYLDQHAVLTLNVADNSGTTRRLDLPVWALVP